MSHGFFLLKKITAAVPALLLLVAGLPTVSRLQAAEAWTQVLT